MRGLFRRKYTRTQQEEVLKFAHRFYSACSPYREASAKFLPCTSQLRKVCLDAKLQDTEPEGVNALIEETRVACEEYAQFLARTHDKYANLKAPAKWYPKKLRKAYQSWGVCLSGEITYLQWVVGALQPPKPLARELGHDKLNIFVQGLNLVAFYENKLRDEPLYGVASAELLLGTDLSPEELQNIIEGS